MRLIRLRTRLREQAGFTMPAVMAGMLVVMLVSVAAIAAATGDTRLSRYDQDDKQAYSAAEAGVNDYLGHLNVDNSYWAKCATVSAPTPVNQIGTTGANRKWRTVPGANARYSIELVPAAGYTSCSTSNPTLSMVQDGNVKIRVTGNVLGTNNYRTINASFRRSGFLDYLWYTKLENQDPSYVTRSGLNGIRTVPTDANGNELAGKPDFKTWATGNTGVSGVNGPACDQYWWGPNGRAKLRWQGKYEYTYNGRQYLSDVTQLSTQSGPPAVNAICGEITFVSGDEVNGPFHSNDDILLCGTPSFGSSGGNDRVDVSGPGDTAAGKGYRSSCSNNNPSFSPKLVNNSETFEPPPSNSSLEQLTDDNYIFTGPTKIAFTNTTMNVTNGGTTQTMNFPPNGIIYVKNGSACTNGYDPTNTEVFRSSSNTCGDVDLSGTYSKDLTISAENDIVVTGTTKRADNTDGLLGLIPNGFVRIWHPVNGSTAADTDSGDCSTNTSTSPTNVRLDAAVLTLTGSFTVDNYWCSGALGTLTVNGAISQTHRGVVGTGSGNTGYLKDYNYNETLRFRSPPHFLDPLQSSWRILRQGEQSPPQRG